MRLCRLAVSALTLVVHPWTARAQSAPASAGTDSQTVVFVCEHGTVKSVVAMAWFIELAAARHLPVRAISRGTSPDPGVPALVQNGLRGDGLTLGPFTPSRFGLGDLADAIAVISFDQPSVAELVGGRVPTTAWDGMPAVSDGYSVARDAIRRRVAALVDSLAAAATRRGTPRP